MGEGPISYQDLRAWEDISGIELMPWEARILRRLSFEYLSERQRAEEAGRPAPYSPEPDDVIAGRDRVAKQVRNLFSGLKKKE